MYPIASAPNLYGDSMKKLILLCLYLICMSIHADETIYVYGNLIAKDIYDESNSITIKTSEDFEKLNTTHVEELINAIPNMNLSKGNSRGKYFQIRGIGERASYEGMPNHSVGVIIDDIDYSGISGLSSLNGISQVEVYKGPQATRMGPGALAGMVHMTSLEPQKELDGNISFSYGNFKTIEENISVAGPLGKRYQGAISISKRDSDGYMANTYLNRSDTNGQDEFGIKAKILGLYEGVKAKLTLHFFELNNGYDAFTQNNSNKTTSDKPGRDDQQTISQALRLEKNLSNSWRSYTIATHSQSKILYSYDEDWGNNIQWNGVSGWNADYDYDIAFPKKSVDFTFDQRLVRDEKLIIGIYGKQSKEDFQEIGFKDGKERKNNFGEFKTRNFAGYIEKQFDLTSRWYFSVGGRLENRRANYSDNKSNRFDPSETMFGGKVSFNYKKDQSNLTYLKLSKGYKAGGFNTQDAVPSDRKEYKQEKLYSLELGNKKLWDDSGLETKASVFLMYRDDIQVKTSFQDDAMDPSSYTFYNDNGASGFSYGAEFEADWVISSALEITSSLGILKTQYGNYSYGSKNLRNREMPHSPEYQFNVLADYSFSDRIYMNTNLYMSDDYYFSNSHNQRSHAYQLVDMKLGYRVKNIDISIWSKNIFNEIYSQRGFYFSNMPPNWNEERYTQRSAPRTYGISAKYKF